MVSRVTLFIQMILTIGQPSHQIHITNKTKLFVSQNSNNARSKDKQRKWQVNEGL